MARTPLTYPALKKNEADSQTITHLILGIYATAIGAVILLVFQHVIPSFHAGRYLIKEIAISTILIVLSILSLLFYSRFINKLRDSSFGTALSIVLSVVFFILVCTGIYFGYFSLLAIGMVFLLSKAFQLYRLMESNGAGQQTIIYLRRISRFYIALTVLTFAVGISIDRAWISTFEAVPNPQEYCDAIKALQDLSTTNPHTVATIKKDLDSLQIQIMSTTLLIRIIFALLIYLFFIAAVYAAYRAILVKEINLQEVLNELEHLNAYSYQTSDFIHCRCNGAISILGNIFLLEHENYNFTLSGCVFNIRLRIHP